MKLGRRQGVRKVCFVLVECDPCLGLARKGPHRSGDRLRSRPFLRRNGSARQVKLVKNIFSTKNEFVLVMCKLCENYRGFVSALGRSLEMLRVLMERLLTEAQATQKPIR